MERYQGIFTAMITPYDENNRVDTKQLEKLVAFNLEKGVKGFYVTGSTGEAFLLTKEERKLIMEVIKSAAPEATVIAHVGSLNEAEAIELACHAYKLGYDAVSSVAPFYYKFSFDEIKNYYFRIADAAQLPMFVYHIPTFSGVNMGKEEMAQFLRDDRFAGIKYTSNDFFTMEQCKTNFPGKVVFNGFDEMFLAGLSMGADGAIGSTYNFMADKFVKIKALFEANDLPAAQAIQKEANRIIALLCKVGVLQAEKEILNQLGFRVGTCRRPFGELTAEQKALLTAEVIPYI